MKKLLLVLFLSTGACSVDPETLDDRAIERAKAAVRQELGGQANREFLAISYGIDPTGGVGVCGLTNTMLGTTSFIVQLSKRPLVTMGGSSDPTLQSLFSVQSDRSCGTEAGARWFEAVRQSPERLGAKIDGNA